MRWIAVAWLSLLVATCGQKGPLTLPEEEAIDLSMLPAQRCASICLCGASSRGNVATPGRRV